MKKNGFIEGTIIATISIVLVKLMGLLYVIPFYSIIGVQGGALYGYAYNIYTIFLAISTTGLPVAISKIISEYNTIGLNEAKIRTFKIGKKIANILAIFSFLLLFIFAKLIATIIIGDLTGGNTVADVTLVIRTISFAILIIPSLSITKGYFQGHKFISPSSNSQIIEQLVRIIIIIFGSYITIKIFNKSITAAVAVALTGAFIGGLIAIIYLKLKMKNNQQLLGLEVKTKDSITNKEIIHKIFKYTFPYVVLSIGAQLYTFVDMILVLRTLGAVGYTDLQVEFIASAISTWAAKLNMIVNSLAMGLTISLIPNIVQSFVKKDWVDVNKKINQTFSMIIVIALPLTIGISFLANPIWTVFYGYSQLGSSVLTYSIFTALFGTFNLVIISILQGLNKYKIAYITAIGGFALNAALDVPLMLLFHYLKLPSYYGAITATVIGYSFSVLMSLYLLRKQHNISLIDSLNTFKDVLLPIFSMIVILLILNTFIPYYQTNKLSSLLTIGIKSLLGGGVYLFIAYKNGLLHKLFGKENIQNIIRKLSFNLIKMDNN